MRCACGSESTDVPYAVNKLGGNPSWCWRCLYEWHHKKIEDAKPLIGCKEPPQKEIDLRNMTRDCYLAWSQLQFEHQNQLQQMQANSLVGTLGGLVGNALCRTMTYLPGGHR